VVARGSPEEAWQWRNSGGLATGGGAVAWLQASVWQNQRGGAEEHGDLRRPARRDDSGTRGSSMTEWFTEKVWQRCDEGAHWAGDGFHDWQRGNT
jgi:hypothetical protein